MSGRRGKASGAEHSAVCRQGMLGGGAVSSGWAMGVTGAVVLFALVAGCASDPRGPTSGEEDRATGGIQARVVGVVDGDTIDVRIQDGSRQRVRLLGIDAPEVAHDAQPGTCGGDQARERARDLMRDRRVALVRDPTQVATDRFGRTLAYVEAEGDDMGRRLVAEGWASAWYPAQARRPQRHDRYRSAQAEAIAARRGMWASCPPPRRGDRLP